MSQLHRKCSRLASACVLAWTSLACGSVTTVSFQDFNAETPVTGAPNTEAIPGFWSFAGNDSAASTENGGGGGLVRTEGVSLNGVGGSPAIFQNVNTAGVTVAGGGNTWWYSGFGTFRWIDAAVGIPCVDPARMSFTLDLRAEGLTNTSSESLGLDISFGKLTGAGEAYVSRQVWKLTDTWQTYGGVIDTDFIPQLVDDDGNNATPKVEGSLLNAGSFTYQFGFYAGDWGNDAGNVVHVDNVNVTLKRPGWIGASGGTWADGANWNDNGGAAPLADTDFPLFGEPASASPVSVVLNQAVTNARVDFDSAQPYTIAGTGSLTLAGPTPGAIVVSGNATQTIAVPVILNKDTTARVNWGGATLDCSAGITGTAKLSKDYGGTLFAKFVRLPVIDMKEGTLRLSGDGTDATTSVVNALTIAGGTFDVANARLIVNYDGSSPRASLRTAVTDGKLLSSTGLTTGQVVVVEAADANVAGTWGGQPVDSTSLLVLYTLKGDANVDRTVNFDDLLALAASYNSPTGMDWTDGDFTGDGSVNFDDLLALAANYNSTVSGSDWLLARAVVPEPVSLSAAVGTLVLMLRRRAR